MDANNPRASNIDHPQETGLEDFSNPNDLIFKDFDADYFKELEGVDGWLAIGQSNCSNQRYFTVLSQEGTKLGIIGVYDASEKKNVTHTVVDPKFRGMGLAGKFKDVLMAKLNLPYLTLTINLSNTSSIRAAEKLPGIVRVSDSLAEKATGKAIFLYKKPGVFTGTVINATKAVINRFLPEDAPSRKENHYENPVNPNQREVQFIRADNPAIRKYGDRVTGANSSITNSHPIPLKSPEGKKILGMLGECSDFLKCLSGSNIHYTMDGAIGLSLRQLDRTNAFLRVHRDVDMLIPEDELNDLDQKLRYQKTGEKWGLFDMFMILPGEGVEPSIEPGIQFTPFDCQNGNRKGLLQALPIGENGEIDIARYDGLTMIDIHSAKRNGGKIVYGDREVLESEFTKEMVILPDGIVCPVVSLYQLAINKARTDRSQDVNDFRYIAPLLDPVEKRRLADELVDFMNWTNVDGYRQAIAEKLSILDKS